MEEFEMLQDDIKEIKRNIKSEIERILKAYPELTIDYATIWMKKKKVKVKLDFKIKA